MESKLDPLPSASRRHSRFFLSCWGFSASNISMTGETTTDTANVTMMMPHCGCSHLPGLVKPVHCTVAQTKHHSEEGIEVFLLLQSVGGRLSGHCRRNTNPVPLRGDWVRSLKGSIDTLGLTVKLRMLSRLLLDEVTILTILFLLFCL